MRLRSVWKNTLLEAWLALAGSGMAAKKALLVLGLIGWVVAPAAGLVADFDAEAATRALLATLSGLAMAAVVITGLFASIRSSLKRISFNDNLLKRSSPDEVAAIMGHELGHYVLGHFWHSVSVYIGPSCWPSCSFSAPRRR